MKMKRKKIRNILMLFFLIVFAVSAWQTYKIKKDYRVGLDTYSGLSQYVSFEETVSATDDNTQGSPVLDEGKIETIPIEVDYATWPEIDFDTLEEINPDIIGWLYIEGTEINYPIVQGSDNDYYLKHLFDGTYNSAGCLFLDAYSESDFTEKNNIVYGHHMKNGTMFYDLMKFKQQEFYDDHTTALLITPTHKYKIYFFSGYVSSTSASAWDVDFSDIGYEQWLQELLGKSCFSSNIQPTTGDRVITLSTCSYEFNNARFVLHGILHEFKAASDE